VQATKKLTPIAAGVGSRRNAASQKATPVLSIDPAAGKVFKNPDGITSTSDASSSAWDTSMWDTRYHQAIIKDGSIRPMVLPAADVTPTKDDLSPLNAGITKDVNIIVVITKISAI
jgi:hypothetical protein